MRTGVVDEAERLGSEKLLTTGEAATLLGISRQQVVNLCEQGLIPFATVGRHRRIRRMDLELARHRSNRLSRESRRSLWLNVAIAGALVRDPESALTLAQENLELMREAHPRGQVAHWLDEWEVLIAQPVEEIVAALVSPSLRSTELRQNSPFAGLLDSDERDQVLAAFTRVAKRR